jgi:hypothetical protein
MPADFLGRGWKFPVEIERDRSIALAEYEQDVREAIRIILLTAQGERVMRPDFGSRLHEFVFETMNPTTIGAMQAAIRDALVTWEPRIQVLTVDIAADPGTLGRLLITIEYRVRATNTRFNLVFPFYVKEQA